MATNLNQLAKKIIEENEYLSLATVDDSGLPWVSILAYSYDDKYNFYFISLPTSKHSQLIGKHPPVSFSIFDSRQLFGKGVGLQLEGKAKEANAQELLDAETIYFGRTYPYGDMNNDFMVGVKKLLATRTYRFYKIKVTTCWINDPHADTDRRVKVDLS